MKAEAKSLISKIIHFREAEYNLALARYENYANGLKPLYEDLKRYELSPETTLAFHESPGGARTERAVNELKERLISEIEKLPAVVQITHETGKQQAFVSLKSILGKIDERQRSGRDAFGPLPIVEGVPTVTEEFKTSLKEEYTFRITTEEQAERYLAFEKAKEAVARLLKAGMVPDRDFSLYSDELVLLGL